MLVLTLRRPWPWAIFSLPPARAKRVENRTWAPPDSAIGQVIAIHAGAGFDEGAREFIATAGGEWPPPEPEHPAGVIVGVVRLAGVRRPSPPRRGERDRWYMGGHGWLLDDVVALGRPVPRKGALGLRTLDAAAELAVQRELRRVA